MKRKLDIEFVKEEPSDVTTIEMEVVRGDDSGDGDEPAKKRPFRKREENRNRKFNTRWLHTPGLREWIAVHDNEPGYVYCRACCCYIRAHLYDLKTHSKAKKHVRQMAEHPGGFPAENDVKTGISPEKMLFSSSLQTIFPVKEGLDSTAISSISGGDNLNPAKLGFIGCGNMAQALLGGFLKNGLVEPGSIIVSAPSETNRNKVRMLGVRTTHDNNVVVNESDMVFICIKPHVVHEVIQALDPLEADHSPLFVSVVSGIKIARLEELLKNVTPYPRVIRTMPNTPCLVSQGCCVYSIGQDVESSEGGVVRCLLSSVGFCEEVKEELIDSVCGLAGSGPAYVYAAIEALADGGVKMGLPRALAQNLAAHMVKGASSMVIETGRHPAQLKDEVCSPGGTTIEGLHVIEKLGLRNALITAVESATLKAKQLGGEK